MIWGHYPFSLLEEIGQCPQEDSCAHIGYELGWILDAFGDDSDTERLRFTSIKSIGVFTGIINSGGWCSRRHPSRAIFPAPPFPGNSWLTPVTTLMELIREGIRQHVCIASAAGGIIGGQMYVYRVFQPWQRATLLIAKELEGHGHWSIADCRSACNAAVDAALLQRIHAWLEAGNAARNSQPSSDCPGQLLFPWMD